MTIEIAGLGDILDHFDDVLIDQFGVLHDGQTVFDGAIDCMKRLRDAGKPAVALTNSGRTKVPNISRLDRFGFTSDMLKDVVTSGDLARVLIAGKVRAGSLKEGDAVLNLSRDHDQTVLDGFGFKIRENVSSDIRLVLISGVIPEQFTRENYKDMLGDLARKGVLAICANPDHIMYANGTAAFGPGIVTEDYEAAGGPIEMVGKPYPEIFEAGLQALGSANPARTLMIGDSPHHDVAGGKTVGCKTMLIAGGIQAQAGASEVEPDFVIDTLKF